MTQPESPLGPPAGRGAGAGGLLPVGVVLMLRASLRRRREVLRQSRG